MSSQQKLSKGLLLLLCLFWFLVVSVFEAEKAPSGWPLIITQ